ncbi:MAG: SusC/RagA family TonB-linked outer membrane protein [Dysgonamonadaceae bacterium]|jgi:TonB-linked SusC/RagA family outer membrane protein|nr:SusC/RagA family TonB-linked outer membrane protein [Dysgonamonadaceae bacterium]
MKYRLFFILLLLFISVGIFAQDIKVSGVVVSAEDGEPIAGASVTVKGEALIGVVTGLNGGFSLNVPANAKTLVISYIGMKTLETPVKEQIEAVMQPDAQWLDEVVVMGMTQTDKRMFTGATAKIDVSKAKLDGIADISRSLEGRAAGVSVQNTSGTFGAAPKIRIRGATSIYGNSKPLWVVDGVVVEDAIDISSDDLSSGNAETLISSAIAGINADDIESIQILKDGSATSIYGARAMGGVIVVTTKKGQRGVSRLSYTGEFTTRLKPVYSDFNIMNSQEQMGIYKELEAKGWLEFQNIIQTPKSGVYGKMYELINTYYPGTDDYALSQQTIAKNAFLREAEFRNTDWFDELFETSVLQNHAVSITSGTEKSAYYISLSAMNDPGWTKASSVERYTVNANASYKISPALDIKVQGGGSRRDQQAPGTLGQDVDPVSGTVERSFDINPYSYALNTSRTLDANTFYKRNYAPFNIFHELENNYIDLSVTEVKFQGELNLKILRGWNASLLGAARYQTVAQEHHIKDRSNTAMAYRAGVKEGEGGEDDTVREQNPFLYRDPDDPAALKETVLPVGGIYNYTGNTMKSLDFRASTSYVGAFDDIHTVNFYGGMEINSTDRAKTWFRGWGFEYDKGGSPFYSETVFKQGKEENSEYYIHTSTLKRNVAFFATGTYSYKGKYVVNTTGRYEGSNRLGRSRNARWLPTWNIGGAWNVHEENWFERGGVLSRAMAKASYSLTADAGPASVTNALPVFKAKTPWRPFSSVMESGLELVEIENAGLTYEKKHELNVGVDVGFLNDRIAVAVDYYRRNNYDLIGQVYTIGVGGGRGAQVEIGGGAEIGSDPISKWANVASLQADGVEIGLLTRNIVTADFAWNTSFIFTRQSNKITDLDSKTRMLDLVKGHGFAMEGYPVRALFSIPFVGLNNEGLPVFINEKGEETVADINFQENEKLDFLVYEGSAEPTVLGSLGNDFSWKGFRLNVFVTYSFGNTIRLDKAFKDEYSDLDAMPREFKNRWMMPGDEAVTGIPVIPSRRQAQNVGNIDVAYNAYNYSTMRTAKGDFIRLKEISLNYDLPRKWTDALKIGSASLKLQATNLFLLYADKKLNGQDPEFFNSGGVAVPMARQFTFTVRLGI